jgi:excisionase family DNA binding protein
MKEQPTMWPPLYHPHSGQPIPPPPGYRYRHDPANYDPITKTLYVEDQEAPSDLLSDREVAKVLGVGLTFVKKLISQRKLQSIKVGRLRRVRRSALDRFVKNQERYT